MTETREAETLRPAGAPMVPMPRRSSESRPRSGGDQDPMGERASQIADAARRVGGDVRQEMGREVDRRSTMAGEQVAGAARDMRHIAGSLRDEGREGPARLIDAAAERADRLAGYLERADADTMMSDVRSMARRSPALLVGGAVILGLAVGRLVMSADMDTADRPRAGA